jgi:hypothetical protein
MPTARRSQLAAPSKSRIDGDASRRNTSVDPASARATGSGRAMVRFLNASSPNTICAAVARTNPTAKATPERLGSGRPIIPITGSSARPNVGSAMKPTASEVTVMPSCAPDSMKLSRLCARTARPALRSPVEAASSSRARLAATNENSAATN